MASAMIMTHEEEKLFEGQPKVGLEWDVCRGFLCLICRADKQHNILLTVQPCL